MPATAERPAAREVGPRSTEILRAAAEFYRDVLWERGKTEVIHRFLGRHGLSESTLRNFGIGYAPVGWSGLIDHLSACGYPPEEIEAAGLATRSHRGGGRYYDLFRSRLVFPYVEPEAGLIGFAARATHPGPSWPRWLVSPNAGPFDSSTALFGFERAAPEIERSGRCAVLRDCLEVLARHQEGERATVAVVRSRVTDEHQARLGEMAATIELAGRRRVIELR